MWVNSGRCDILRSAGTQLLATFQTWALKSVSTADLTAHSLV